MNETDFEAQVRSIASRMQYPRTPDIAGSIGARLPSSTRPRFLSRTVAWSLTIVLVLIGSLMLIPPARAAILEFIQIGVVRIFSSEPTPLPAPTEQSPSGIVPVTATPESTVQPLIPLLKDVAGETTLENAQKTANYPILLPTYPPGLGKPDYVFVQDAAGVVTVLVWLDPQNPDRVLMSLHFLPSGSWAIKKIEPTIIEETRVNGHRAVWTIGPYLMMLKNGDMQLLRMINGHVLIWEADDITYRLETDASLDDAIKIAESLKRISSP